MNSEENIELANRIFRAFGGNWAKVRKASKQDTNGVWLISQAALEDAERKNKAAGLPAYPS
jgi:hypothetical protein